MSTEIEDDSARVTRLRYREIVCSLAYDWHPLHGFPPLSAEYGFYVAFLLPAVSLETEGRGEPMPRVGEPARPVALAGGQAKIPPLERSRDRA